MGPNNLGVKQAEFRGRQASRWMPLQLKHHSSDLSTQIEVRNKIYSSGNKILGKLLSFTSIACFLQDTAEKNNNSIESVCSVQ